jgi:choline kinase
VKIVIAAAGEGSRLGMRVPKAMVEVAGKTILEYQLGAFSNDDDVRIVAGFKIAEISELAARLNPRVKIYENSDYSTTGVPYGCLLACGDINEPTLFVDGDLIFDKSTVDKFREIDSGIGVCDLSTEHPVMATVHDGKVISFDRKVGNFEWACVCKIHPSVLCADDRYMFYSLRRNLPISAVPIERIEIDTPADLELAENLVRSKQ